MSNEKENTTESKATNWVRNLAFVLKNFLRIISLAIVCLVSLKTPMVFCGLIDTKRPPLHGKFFDKPGNFELILRLLENVIDPGEWIEVEGYITG